MVALTRCAAWFSLGLLLCISGCGGGKSAVPVPTGTVDFTYNWPESAPFGLDAADYLTIKIGKQQSALRRPNTLCSFLNIASGDQPFTIRFYDEATTGDMLLVEAHGKLPITTDQFIVKDIAYSLDASTPVSMAVTPDFAALSIGESLQCTAVVSGSHNRTVTWNIAETNGGVITPDGLYTAPSDPGVYHISAQSPVHPTVHKTITVLVEATGGEIIVQ